MSGGIVVDTRGILLGGMWKRMVLEQTRTDN